jgi:uncharacterized membrane protein YkoI
MPRRAVLITGLVLALGGLSAGIAFAAAGGDDDRPLTGATLAQAEAAALAHTGGGTVVETEVGDDGAAYGVEVRLEDGTQVEVMLDESFRVIGEEADDDGAGEADDADDAD